jgi:hypothetical protein
MAEQTPYFDSITSARSMLLTEEQQLEGATTISMETTGDVTEESLRSYLEENFAQFLRHVRFLKPQDQELVLSYYILSKPQTLLGPLIASSTQTVCSFRLRTAVKVLCLFMMMGIPSAGKMKPVLESAGLEHLMPMLPLSAAVELFGKTHSFRAIADKHGMHRPDIRRAMSRASKELLAMGGGLEQGLGAYILNLIDKANPSGVGLTKREAAKAGDIHRSDPEILGQFRMDVEDPDFDQMFASRANL